MDMSELTRLMRSINKIAVFRRGSGIKGKSKSSEYSFSGGESSIVSTNKDNEEEDEKLRRTAAMETLIAELFATVAAIKAEYAQLQIAQSPYDPDTIQSSDLSIVSHLQRLSFLKQTHLNKLPINGSKTGAELREQRSLLKTFELTSKKLESELRKKDSEVTVLKNQMSETEVICRWMEENLSSSPAFAPQQENGKRGFIAELRQSVKLIRSFVKLMMEEMAAAEWDLAAAAAAISPDVTLLEDFSFAFESFVCGVVFSDFNLPKLGIKQRDAASPPPWFSPGFQDADLMEFCRVKYTAIVHRDMETSFFGGGNRRACATKFFLQFAEMAKRVWLLHRLFSSLGKEEEVGIFRVERGCRFSTVFMESVVEHGGSAVGFTVVPGFRLGKTVIQCKVYPAR